MHRNYYIMTGWLLTAAIIGIAPASAADGGSKTAPLSALTPAGETLRAKYAEALATLQAEVAQALPKIDERKKSALQEAQQAEQAAKATPDARGIP